jgi:predicted homoserine dehydrogenase-like protein
VVEVCALAKKDLQPGDTLDQIGEYTYRAWAMEVGRAQAARALPAGMLTGAKVTAPIKKGELITLANTTLPHSRLVELRRRQDMMLFGKDLLNA